MVSLEEYMYWHEGGQQHGVRYMSCIFEISTRLFCSAEDVWLSRSFQVRVRSDGQGPWA